MNAPSNLPPGCPSDDGLSPDEHAWEGFLDRIMLDETHVEDAIRRWDSQPALVKALELTARMLSEGRVAELLDERLTSPDSDEARWDEAVRAALKEAGRC